LLKNTSDSVATDIQYRISLVAGFDEREGEVADRVYSSIIEGPIFLLPGEEREIEFSYTIPEAVDRSDTAIQVQAMTGQGVLLGWEDVRVEVRGSGGEVRIDSAELIRNSQDRAPPQAGGVVTSSDDLEIAVTLENEQEEAIELTPHLQVFKVSVAGDIIEETEVETVAFSKGEEQTISIPLPTDAPGTFAFRVEFRDENGVSRTPLVEGQFSVAGPSATIYSITPEVWPPQERESQINVLFVGPQSLPDTSGRIRYTRNEEGEFVRSNRDGTSSEITNAEMILSMKDSSGNEVAHTKQEGVHLTSDSQIVTLPVSFINSIDEDVTVEVKIEKNGEVLGEYTTFFPVSGVQTDTEGGGFVVTVGVLLLVLVVLVVLQLKGLLIKGKNSIPVALLFAALIVAGAAFVAVQTVFSDHDSDCTGCGWNDTGVGGFEINIDDQRIILGPDEISLRALMFGETFSPVIHINNPKPYTEEAYGPNDSFTVSGAYTVLTKDTLCHEVRGKVNHLRSNEDRALGPDGFSSGTCDPYGYYGWGYWYGSSSYEGFSHTYYYFNSQHQSQPGEYLAPNGAWGEAAILPVMVSANNYIVPDPRISREYTIVRDEIPVCGFRGLEEGYGYYDENEEFQVWDDAYYACDTHCWEQGYEWGSNEYDQCIDSCMDSWGDMTINEKLEQSDWSGAYTYHFSEDMKPRRFETWEEDLFYEQDAQVYTNESRYEFSSGNRDRLRTQQEQYDVGENRCLDTDEYSGVGYDEGEREDNAGNRTWGYCSIHREFDWDLGYEYDEDGRLVTVRDDGETGPARRASRSSCTKGTEDGECQPDVYQDRYTEYVSHLERAGLYGRCGSNITDDTDPNDLDWTFDRKIDFLDERTTDDLYNDAKNRLDHVRSSGGEYTTTYDGAASTYIKAHRMDLYEVDAREVEYSFEVDDLVPGKSHDFVIVLEQRDLSDPDAAWEHLEDRTYTVTGQPQFEPDTVEGEIPLIKGKEVRIKEYYIEVEYSSDDYASMSQSELDANLPSALGRVIMDICISNSADVAGSDLCPLAGDISSHRVDEGGVRVPMNTQLEPEFTPDEEMNIPDGVYDGNPQNWSDLPAGDLATGEQYTYTVKAEDDPDRTIRAATCVDEYEMSPETGIEITESCDFSDPALYTITPTCSGGWCSVTNVSPSIPEGLITHVAFLYLEEESVDLEAFSGGNSVGDGGGCVPYGSDIDLEWETAGALEEFCSASSSSGDWTGNKSSAGGSDTQVGLTNTESLYEYTLQCAAASDGTLVEDTASVSVCEPEPTDLQATESCVGNDAYVELDWDGTTAGIWYEVFRKLSTEPDLAFSSLETVADTEYRDPAVSSPPTIATSTEYVYKVEAVNSDNTSESYGSDSVTVTTNSCETSTTLSCEPLPNEDGTYTYPVNTSVTWVVIPGGETYIWSVPEGSEVSSSGDEIDIRYSTVGEKDSPEVSSDGGTYTECEVPGSANNKINISVDPRYEEF
ncbi:MAG: hypothetical protein WEC58_02745, partial [Candidatus Paceibacterota bacterium]